MFKGEEGLEMIRQKDYLPGVVKYYLNHIGILDGELDYKNRKVILGMLCASENQLERAIKELDKLPWYLN